MTNIVWSRIVKLAAVNASKVMMNNCSEVAFCLLSEPLIALSASMPVIKEQGARRGVGRLKKVLVRQKYVANGRFDSWNFLPGLLHSPLKPADQQSWNCSTQDVHAVFLDSTQNTIQSYTWLPFSVKSVNFRP